MRFGVADGMSDDNAAKPFLSDQLAPARRDSPEGSNGWMGGHA